MSDAASQLKGQWRSFVVTTLVLAVIGGAIALFRWINESRMQDRPELLYFAHEKELADYAQRLDSDQVQFVEGRGFGIPPYLIDYGARYCTKHGDCFCISFGFMADSSVPELWYSPEGLKPPPPPLANKLKEGVRRWQILAPKWAACYW